MELSFVGNARSSDFPRTMASANKHKNPNFYKLVLQCNLCVIIPIYPNLSTAVAAVEKNLCMD